MLNLVIEVSCRVFIFCSIFQLTSALNDLSVRNSITAVLTEIARYSSKSDWTVTASCYVNTVEMLIGKFIYAQIYPYGTAGSLKLLRQ